MSESAPVRIRRIDAEEWMRFRELRLAALTEAPYAFRSTLAEWQGDGDREERWRARLTQVPFNVLAEWDGRDAGMVSGTVPDADGSVELISMWVAPFARGNGLADALVESVIKWAAGSGAERTILGVALGNDRAAALYRKHGFADTEVVESPGGDGYWETRMVRELKG
jgi:ribosomal protein S18 acetylase RimI-like enzyme